MTLKIIKKMCDRFDHYTYQQIIQQQQILFLLFLQDDLIDRFLNLIDIATVIYFFVLYVATVVCVTVYREKI